MESALRHTWLRIGILLCLLSPSQAGANLLDQVQTRCARVLRELVQDALDAPSLFWELGKIEARPLPLVLRDGASRFIVGAPGEREIPTLKFEFSKALDRQLAPGRHSIHEAQAEGRKYILKPISDSAADSEIKVAQRLHALGLGPESHLLLVRKTMFQTLDGQPHTIDSRYEYLLVLEKVPGLNSKNVQDGLTPPQIQWVSDILGKTFSSEYQARSAYSKAILADRMLVEKMKRAGRVLDRHFSHIPDFQFLIQPATHGREGQFWVIDAGWAVAKGLEDRLHLPGRSSRPSVLLEDFLESLEKLRPRRF